jgi:hypothetical protein
MPQGEPRDRRIGRCCFLLAVVVLVLGLNGVAAAAVPTKRSTCDRLASFNGTAGTVATVIDSLYGGKSRCRARTIGAGTAKAYWNTRLAYGDDLYFGLAVREGPTNTTLARLVQGTNSLRLRLDAKGRAIVRYNSRTLAGPVHLTPGCWTHLEVHAVLGGTARKTQLYKNGKLVHTDSRHANYPGSPYTSAQFGAIGTTTAQTVSFDRVTLQSTRHGGRGECPPLSKPCGRVASRPASWGHVVWVVMENKSYSDIIGSSSAPYLNELASKCGLATNYHAVTHPSLPNYIAMTSGSTQGVTDDRWPVNHPLTGPSIFSQLGLGWRSLQESMPSSCFLTDWYPYAVRHNPAAYFTNIRTACYAHDVPLGVNPNISARFTEITPNVCNDTHDCSIATGDRWLSTLVPKLVGSKPYRAGNTLIVITWDEDDGSASNHIPTLVIAPSTVPGTRYGGALDHYSLLRNAQQLLGLSCLGNSCTAADMRAPFNL